VCACVWRRGDGGDGGAGAGGNGVVGEGEG
jgi:hypothetical protein